MLFSDSVDKYERSIFFINEKAEEPTKTFFKKMTD
jgi:hypothetical protein